MRKRQKQAIEDMIQTLFEAHDEIKRSVESSKAEQAMDLLGQCQEAAIQVGTGIEESEGEDIPTIGLLEKYCEQLYHFHQELSAAQQSQRQTTAANKVYKNLRKQLIQIETSIKHDIPVTLEAVFMPYKAAMWDSLEGVWQAAAEDESCDAYVVPIPYYDRNPDQSLGEIHYEGDLFPQYVPVTHYEEYNLKQRQPDLIFIHNPYDDRNLVTSVHPDFYSSRLKEYTDCLVYIPYFVLREIAPDDSRAVDLTKHYCTTPGVINADKVIVQSKAMEQIYVNVLAEQAGEQTRAYWEQKILGLGSPKLDKVRSIAKSELEIPEEWMERIQKPDGSWKKILLYNTSIGPLLQQREQMPDKMQEIFHIFQKKQDDIAFIWRPHPLIPATIESMLPALWQKYQGLMEAYQREGWGIYDNTPDVDRAVVLSDAYYGDWSSVIELYEQTEKPVMIQDVHAKTETGSRESTVTFNACRLWKGYLYFFSNTDSMFARLDLNTGEAEFLEPSMKHTYIGARVIGMTYSKDQYLYALETGGDHLMVMDLEKLEFQYIRVDCYQGSTDNYALITGHNDYIYIFPRSRNSIIRITADTLEKTELPIDADMGPADHSRDTFQYACQFKDKVLLISPSNHILVEFDMDSEHIERTDLPEQMADCIYMTWFDSKLWALTKEGTIKRFSEGLELEHYIKPKQGFELQEPHIGRIQVTHKNIVLLPNTGEDIFVVDLETEEISPYEDYPKDFQYMRSKNWAKYPDTCEDTESYYCSMKAANYLLKIGKQDGKLVWIKPNFPPEQERLKYYEKNHASIFDEANFSLQVLMDQTAQADAAYKTDHKQSKEIWETVKLE